MPSAVTKPEGYESHRTVSEVAQFLGLSTRTIERHWREGRIPEPAHRFGNMGTKLWSPEQCNEMLVMRLGRLPSARAAKRRITR